MFRYLLFLFPVLLQAGYFDWFETLSPKAQRAKDVLEGCDEIVEKAIQEFQIPGIAIGIVVDGHVVYAKGFGFRDLEKKLPVDANTLFAIGSCSKAFTTFTMGNLVDEGLLDWDLPVIDVLPEFRLWDQYATTNVTLRDLLTHRTGMPRHDLVWYNSKMSKTELLKRIRHLHPTFDLRERYQYGNLMYFVAGQAMERVTGKSWEELIQERILTPLQMKHTNFSVHEMQKSYNFSNPYIEKNGQFRKMPFRDLSLIASAGAINSNVLDMCRWLALQTAGGMYQNQPMISPTTLQEILAPQVVVPGAPESKETLLYAYSMGWNVLSYRGRYYASHDGISDGFTSLTGFFPSDNVGIVILANKNMTAFPRYLSFQLIDRVLELPQIDWLNQAREGLRKNKEVVRPPKMHEMGVMHCHPLEEYAGIYENPGYGQLFIEVVNGKLEATYNDLQFVLNHSNYDVFKVVEEKQDILLPVEGMRFTFCNNSNGDIAELIVPLEPKADDVVFKRQASAKHAPLSYLKQFTGLYEIYGYTVEMAVKNHTLVAIIPGQPIYDLIPAGENEFQIKSMTGSTVRFIMDEANKVSEILLIHPYGVFSAQPRR